MTWFQNNFMQPNIEKFQFLFIHTKYTRKDYAPDVIEINDTKIKGVIEIKFPGIIINIKLKFDIHVGILCNNATQANRCYV